MIHIKINYFSGQDLTDRQKKKVKRLARQLYELIGECSVECEDKR